jgi:hypothetical protein
MLLPSSTGFHPETLLLCHNWYDHCTSSFMGVNVCLPSSFWSIRNRHDSVEPDIKAAHCRASHRPSKRRRPLQNRRLRSLTRVYECDSLGKTNCLQLSCKWPDPVPPEEKESAPERSRENQVLPWFD